MPQKRCSAWLGLVQEKADRFASPDAGGAHARASSGPAGSTPASPGLGFLGWSESKTRKASVRVGRRRRMDVRAWSVSSPGPRPATRSPLPRCPGRSRAWPWPVPCTVRGAAERSAPEGPVVFAARPLPEPLFPRSGRHLSQALHSSVATFFAVTPGPRDSPPTEAPVPLAPAQPLVLCPPPPPRNSGLRFGERPRRPDLLAARDPGRG